MIRKSILAVSALSLVALSGCSSFLDAKKAVADPNNPTLASRNQLFVGAQANMFGEQEGPVAMAVCEWMQQCAGVNGRFVDSWGTYTVTPGSFDGSMQSLYTAGGLVGLRDIQASATTDGDFKYRGVAKVIEAIDMMWGADMWGDIPYSEAVGSKTNPKFDTQQSIYTAIDALLTAAITDMGNAGTGPGAYDLIYGGNMTQWIQAAHTLKARIQLRLVENGGGAAAYTAALNEANLGISSSANDFRTYHTAATSERNMWAQFQNTSFGPDLVAGAKLATIMNTDADPRRSEYFALNPSGTYGGYDVTTQATPVSQISLIFGSGRTNNVTFRQPLITWEENQLIKAEALCSPNLTTQACTGTAGNQALALAALNAVRTARGKAAVGALTLAAIMQEKYIVTFQNVEAWSDYKRTCLPALTPARGRTVIPGRLYYGDTEMQTNTSAPTAAENIQSNSTTAVSATLIVRNWNDPNHC